MDSIGMFARTAYAKTWCDVFRFPKQRTFAIKKYSREDAGILSHETAARGNYYIRLAPWDLAGGFVYTQEMVDSYEASPAFVEWMAGITSTVLRRAADEVMTLTTAVGMGVA